MTLLSWWFLNFDFFHLFRWTLHWFLIIEKINQFNFVNCICLIFHRMVNLFRSLIQIQILVLFLFHFVIGQRFHIFYFCWWICFFLCLHFVSLKFLINNTHKICKFVFFWLFCKGIEILIQILMCELHCFKDIFVLGCNLNFIDTLWFFIHGKSEWGKICFRGFVF